MDKQLHTLRNIANERTWASFLNDNHPYSLLHWSIAGVGQEAKDVWLLQDEVTFQTTEFPTLDDAMQWISENMEQVTDVLALKTGLCKPVFVLTYVFKIDRRLLRTLLYFRYKSKRVHRVLQYKAAYYFLSLHIMLLSYQLKYSRHLYYE